MPSSPSRPLHLRPGPPVLDLRTGARLACVDGEPMRLTPMEFDLLVFLVDHPDQVHSRHDLLTRVWAWRSPDRSRTIDTHVARLRRKLGRAGSAIRTSHRAGYVFASDAVQLRSTGSAVPAGPEGPTGRTGPDGGPVVSDMSPKARLAASALDIPSSSSLRSPT